MTDVSGSVVTAENRGEPPSRSGIGRIWATFNNSIDLAAVFIVLLLICVVLLQVFCRYVLNAALQWPEEVACWTFVWLTFIGVGLVQRDHGHLAIDFIPAMLFTGRSRLGFNIFVTAIASSVCFALVYYGYLMVEGSTMPSPVTNVSFGVLYAAAVGGGALTLVYLVVGGGINLEGEFPPSLRLASNIIGILVGAAIFGAISSGLVNPLLTVSPTAVLMISACALMALGVPLGFSMLFAVFAALAPEGELIMMTAPQTLTQALNSFVLLSVPFYMLAASLMNLSGVTVRLVEFSTVLVGWLRGGLGYVNIVASALMAGITGSSIADVAAFGRILIKPMEEQGYTRTYASAITATSSTMANLIPPGIGFIVYSAIASASTGALFLAGVVPGLLVGVVLFAMNYFVARKLSVIEVPALKQSWGRSRVFLRALPALVLPFGIVFGINLGICTATEAGALAAFYAVFVGAFIYRGLNWKGFIPAVREALMDTFTVAFLIAVAAPFGWVLTIGQAPQRVAAAIVEFSGDPIVLLLLINLMLLVAGCFMDMIAALVILVPIFLPMIAVMGIDPIHFGVVVILNLILGGVTPPFGLLIFTAARVGNAPVAAVFKTAFPMFLGLLVLLAAVTYFPAISLTLPSFFW
ncbi:MAG: TRAP transporter large permease subunit [Nitratireductor sp.]|nr:TRAP transporter large permease subunit [Nitratireductor sp.]